MDSGGIGFQEGALNWRNNVGNLYWKSRVFSRSEIFTRMALRDIYVYAYISQVHVTYGTTPVSK